MGKKSIFCLLLLILLSLARGSTIPEETENSLQDQIDRLSQMLERLDSLHSSSIDKKFSSVINAITQVDSNVRSLHEKSATWNIFLHHVQAWTDSMKAIDHKVDLIKLAQEETENLENKLNSMEFSINHILTKLDILNEKSRGSPDVLEKVENINKVIQRIEHDEAEERKDVSKKLNAIMRHILNMDYSRTRESRRAKMSRGTHSEVEYYNQNFEAIEYKLDRVMESITGISDLEEIVTNQQKNLELLKNIQELVQAIDERSVRLYDAEAQHSSKLLSCCRHSSDELATFTGSSDLLLKRIEKLVTDIQLKVRKIGDPKNVDEPPIVENESKTTGAGENSDNVKPLDKSNETSSRDFGDKREKDTPTPVEDNNDKEQPKVENEGKPVDKSVNSEEEEEDEDVTEVIRTRILDLPEKTGCEKIEERIDGIYRFQNSSSNEVRNYFERYCTFSTDGSGWTVIQRRGPYEIQENFNRTWQDYKYGFGDLHRDFWFGNEFIYRMVSKEIHELRIEMEDFEGTQVWAEYSIFQVEPEKYNYKLLIGGYRGSVTDSMLYSDSMEFSTYDRQHDRTGLVECCSCATGYGSGWWFDNCSEANLNGIYRDTPRGHNYIGIVWENWHGDYSVKKTRMLIRPRNIWREEDDNDDDVFSNLPLDP